MQKTIQGQIFFRIPSGTLLCAAFLGLVLGGCSTTSSSDGAPPVPVTGSVQAGPTSASGFVVLAKNGSLVRVDRAGKNQVVLTSGFVDLHPSFRPDGSDIIFSRQFGDGKAHIMRIRANGSGLVDLTPGLNSPAFEPVYSDNGNKIAFSVEVGPNDQDIYLMNSDGSGIQALTTGPTLDRRPAWSPDGSSLVFERGSQIARVRITGGVVELLTDGSQVDSFPTYCPPTDLVVFSRNGELFSIENQVLKQVTNSPEAAEFQSRHSPEHDKIYALASLGNSRLKAGANEPSGELFVMQPDGSGRQQLSQTLGASSFSVGPASPLNSTAGATMEIVNDSEFEDKDVYVILTGNNGATVPQVAPGSGLTVLDLNAANLNPASFQPVKATSLASMTSAGTITTDTGKTRNIHRFQVDQIAGGVLWVSYNEALEFKAAGVPASTVPSPDSHTKIRYDKFEMTYLPKDNKVFADTTSIDFFGIPMQLDRLTGATVSDRRTVYVNTSTLMKTVNQLSPTMAPVFRDVQDGQYAYNPADPSEPKVGFARIESGKSLASSQGSKGLPTPYPSMRNYMAGLAANRTLVNTVANTTVTSATGQGVPKIRVTGFEHSTGYDYSGNITEIVTDGNVTGYDIEMTGSMDLSQLPAGTSFPAAITPGQPIVCHFPVSEHKPVNALDDPGQSTLDNFIFGAPSSPYAFDLKSPGLTVTTHDLVPASSPPAFTPESKSQLDAITNSAYINVYGDLTVGLMSGYIGGRYPSDSSGWFRKGANLVTQFPFAGARPNPDDGFYDTWAAIVYNLSDAYGHPYSDRGGRPNPTLTLPPTDVLRCTLLDDHRLNAPEAKVTAAAQDQLSLQWPTVDGATSYNVTVSPPYPSAVTQVASNSTTLTGLTAGTPYSISVQANASATNHSNSVAVQAVTSGNVTPLNVAGGVSWQQKLSFSLEQGILLAPDVKVSINGADYPVVNGTTATNPPVTINGKVGLNTYVLQVSDTNGPIYQGNFVVKINPVNAPVTPTNLGFINLPNPITWFVTDPIHFFLEGGEAQPAGGLALDIGLAPGGFSFPLPAPFSWPPAVFTVPNQDPKRDPKDSTVQADTQLKLSATFLPAPRKQTHPVIISKP
jgi:Tol biopolymer transport system component